MNDEREDAVAEGTEREEVQAGTETYENGEGAELDSAEDVSVEGELEPREEAEEEVREEVPRPRQPTYVETLERRLQETQDQLREYIQAYKQTKEDMEQFKRRLEREAQKDLTTLRGKLVTELIEVLDNLDRSVMGGESGWNAEALLQGVKMVQSQFLEKLQGLGLEPIDPTGQPFDPNEAEALDVAMAADPEQDNTVSRVYSRGYRMGDRVIRPARVQVARVMDGR